MDLLPLFGFLGACFAAASTGAIFRPGAWYEGLSKPSWRPPNRLFGPAWAVLYTLIAISAWLVWREAGLGVEIAVWAGHLAINAGWSWIFFGLRRPDLAFGWILLLWASIAATIAAFAAVSQPAAWLLLPYLAWVSFAAALNLAIWRRNPRAA
ncbi:MAG: tryptophan-rich sensory protein [Acetobacteraceae bacterium]|nr:tryptophan-rich sensory protein [Acetobacteraceae bacterium]MCX7683799.1 tryptophan-rich sensory protein [Acetobacteraceae bacterium]MDW8398330.1 TspO/MBR family protein [Acetobacteraceae bacterium]